MQTRSRALATPEAEMREVLLTDDQVQRFVQEGYLVLPSSPHPHQSIAARADALLPHPGAANPDDEVHEQIPELAEVFNQPSVRGALQSLLGRDYLMHAHRHLHDRWPSGGGQQFHRDDTVGVSHWNSGLGQPWMLIAFYYPRVTTLDMGPTAVLPGSHLTGAAQPGRAADDGYSQTWAPWEHRLCTEQAGAVVLCHYNLVHRGLANNADRVRFMIKYNFIRLQAPDSASWQHTSASWRAPPPEDATDCTGYASAQTRTRLVPVCRQLWRWLCAEPAGPFQIGELGRIPDELFAPAQGTNGALISDVGVLRCGLGVQGMAPDLVGEMTTPQFCLLGSGEPIPADLSGRHGPFSVSTRFRTGEADGCIFSKSMPDGGWVDGGEAGQGKMCFIRDGRVCFDIGWVGCITSDVPVHDGQWHEVQVQFDSFKYWLQVDGSMCDDTLGLSSHGLDQSIAEIDKEAEMLARICSPGDCAKQNSTDKLEQIKQESKAAICTAIRHACLGPSLDPNTALLPKATRLRLLVLLIVQLARNAPSEAANALAHLLSAPAASLDECDDHPLSAPTGCLSIAAVAAAGMAVLATSLPPGGQTEDAARIVCLSLVAALARAPGAYVESSIVTALGIVLSRRFPKAGSLYDQSHAWAAVRAVEHLLHREESDDILRCDCVLALARIGTAANSGNNNAGCSSLREACAQSLGRALSDEVLDYFGSELAQRVMQRWH